MRWLPLLLLLACAGTHHAWVPADQARDLEAALDRCEEGLEGLPMREFRRERDLCMEQAGWVRPGWVDRELGASL